MQRMGIGRAAVAAMLGLMSACQGEVIEGLGQPPPAQSSPGAGSPGTGSPGTGSPGTGSPGTGSPSTGSPNPGTSDGSGIFPVDNAWNASIENAPLDPKSDAYIASIGAGAGLHADFSGPANGSYGIPFVEVPADQARVPVTFTDYPEESDPGPYPIPDNPPVETGDDRHLLVVDRGNGFLYEIFGAAHGSKGWTGMSGAKWNLRTGDPRPLRWTSADAAGLPIFPGLVRYEEVATGEIKHALRFTINRSQKGFVAPATHAAGSCAMGSDCPPMGLRLRLKKSVDLSRFPQSVQVILRAMQKYGMIVADNGSNWFISGSPSQHWVDDDIVKISGIKGGDFEVVASGSIMPQ